MFKLINQKKVDYNKNFAKCVMDNNNKIHPVP